jgi:hypothetical protein
MGTASDTHPHIDDRIAKLKSAGTTISAQTAKRLEEIGADHTGRDVHFIGQDEHLSAAPSRFASQANSSVGTQYDLQAPGALHEEPNPRSRVVEKLDAGAQVVVFEKNGKFFQAVGPRGTFGYLSVNTPMQRVGGPK